MAGYGTDQGLADWATLNGYTLPVGAPAPAVLRQRGSVYIDATYGERFPGEPTAGVDQDRSWPRTGATVNGVSLDSAFIPAKVIEASYYAAYFEALKPGSLAVIVNPANLVKRQKVGPIEREFFTAGERGLFESFAPISSIIEGLLAPFLSIYNDEPAVLLV